MSNPKDKAKELIDKFSLVGLQQRNEGVQCALIAVNEILLMCMIFTKDYWQEVKQEILNQQ
jgi:hypothetical protein